MTTVLITGTSRGIGLELVRQYAEAGARVIATCRHPAGADALNELAKDHDVEVRQLDVPDPDSISKLTAGLDGEDIDILINNAGVMGGRQTFGDMDYAAWMDAFATNTMGPVRVAEAVANNLTADATVATISSQMGSLARNATGAYAYRTTKAAVNKAVQLMANDLGGDGRTVIAMHPGWVKTDMGGNTADITPEESAAGIRSVIASLTPSDNGRFIKWNGEDHPW